MQALEEGGLAFILEEHVGEGVNPSQRPSTQVYGVRPLTDCQPNHFPAAMTSHTFELLQNVIDFLLVG